MPFPVGRIPDRFSSLTVEIPPKMDLGTPFSKDGEKVVPVLINTKEEQVLIDYPSIENNRIAMKSFKRLSEALLKEICCRVNSYTRLGKYIEGRNIYFFPYKEGVETNYQIFKDLFLSVFNTKERDIKEEEIEAIQQKNTGLFVLQVIRVNKVKSSIFFGHFRDREGPTKWVTRMKEVVVQLPICIRAFGTRVGLYILEDKNFTNQVSALTKEWFDSFKIRELITTSSIQGAAGTAHTTATSTHEIPAIREVNLFCKDGNNLRAVTVQSGSEQVQVHFPADPKKLPSLKNVPRTEFVGDKQIANLGKQFYVLLQGEFSEEKYMVFIPYSGKLETYQAFKNLFLEISNAQREEIQDSDIQSIHEESAAPFALQVVRGRRVKSFEVSTTPKIMPDGRPGTRTSTEENATIPICLRAYGTKAGIYLLNDKTFDGNVMSEGTKEWFESFKVFKKKRLANSPCLIV